MTDEEQPVESHELHEASFEGELQVRDAGKRELEMRIVPWNVTSLGRAGPERFLPGAFDGIDPARVVLLLEHQNDSPAGKGLSLEERSDGAYMVMRAANTARGDEILELAREGITRGVSVSYYDRDVPVTTEKGRRTRTVRKADLRAVSTTWRPTWSEAAVLNVRSQEVPDVPETPATPEAPPAPPALDLSPLATVLQQQGEMQQRSLDAFTDRMTAIEERYRSDITVPAAPPKKTPSIGEWASAAVRMLHGIPVGDRELQERALDDVITTLNPGLVPDAFRQDLLKAVFNPARPFLETTTEIEPPETGMSISVPVLSTRSTAAVQATEKTEVESTAMRVTVEEFPVVTIAGAADVSIQMLRRADRSFFSLLMRDLGFALARAADARAILTLFNAGTTPGTGNLDPEDLSIGEAWENSMTATGLPPSHIWLSAAGVSAFIDAKNDGTNSPLYFNLNANITVGGGPGGDVSALTPVYVPALNGTSVDVMIGPRSGFAWAEDGEIRLESDNPTLAGRDIALVSMFFFIPRYPLAFTTYDLGS